MAHRYHTPYLLDDDTEINVSGTVKRNPYYTRNMYAEHYTPDEEPFDIEITSMLPNAITSRQIEEIEELLFEAYAEDGEEVHPNLRTQYI